MNEKSSNEKRLAALGSRGRGPPRSGGRAWSFRLLDFHRYSADGNGRCRERCLWSRWPGKTRGKVHQNRGKSRHFPRGWRRQVRREGLVVPVPRQAIGESAPESQEIPALSPRVETAGAARGACGAGAQTSYGGKCTRIAGNRGTFPEGGDGRCGERGLWCRCLDKP